MVEGGVEDLVGGDAAGEKFLDDLEEKGGLPHLTGAGEQQRPGRGRRLHPREDVVKCSPPPIRQVGGRCAAPPGIVLPQHGNEFGRRCDHAKQPKSEFR